MIALHYGASVMRVSGNSSPLDTQRRPVRAFEVADGDVDLELDDVPLFSGYLLVY